MAGLAFLSALSSVAPAIALGGTVLSAVGAAQQGRAQQSASNYQAAQLEAAGLTERATAQRTALEQKRQGELAISRARAVAAASGGGQDIPLLGRIEEDSALRQQTAIWEGDEAAKGRRMQAGAARYEGSQYARAGVLRAGTTLLSGGASFWDKYA